MTYIDALILGLVQGLTEFLPISSSGHLVIASHLLGVKSAFTYDTLLNFGTLGSLIVYYRNRIWLIITRTFAGREWLFLAKLGRINNLKSLKNSKNRWSYLGTSEVS